MASDPPVILVTAGSAGLGAATARLFAESGYRVVINYSSNAERAHALAAELEAASPLAAARPAGRRDVAVVQADLSRRDDVVRLVAEAAAAMGGRLDAVFSNGGWTRFRGLDSLDDNAFDEDWDRCFVMNVKQHLWLLHAARPYLDAAEEGGAFVTTASLAGVGRVSGSSLAYSVTKAAQIHLVKGLALLASPTIRVNSVSPGVMLTEWGMQFSPEKRAELQERSKLKRFASVEEVALQVLCFVKSKAVTGANALIDAGMSI